MDKDGLVKMASMLHDLFMFVSGFFYVFFSKKYKWLLFFHFRCWHGWFRRRHSSYCSMYWQSQWFIYSTNHCRCSVEKQQLILKKKKTNSNSSHSNRSNQIAHARRHPIAYEDSGSNGQDCRLQCDNGTRIDWWPFTCTLCLQPATLRCIWAFEKSRFLHIQL